MTNNIYRPGGYISDRYGRPKPRVTLDVAIEEKKLTLGTLRHLVDKAANFSDDARIALTPELVRVIQESTKPVTLHHRGGGHLQWSTGLEEVKKNPQPRDHLGRFTKRK